MTPPDNIVRPTEPPTLLDECHAELAKIRASLDVLDFTVHFLSLLIPAHERELCQGQIAAAHEAYRHATGEDSWDVLIAQRSQERANQCQP